MLLPIWCSLYGQGFRSWAYNLEIFLKQINWIIRYMKPSLTFNIREVAPTLPIFICKCFFTLQMSLTFLAVWYCIEGFFVSGTALKAGSNFVSGLLVACCIVLTNISLLLIHFRVYSIGCLFFGYFLLGHSLTGRDLSSKKDILDGIWSKSIKQKINLW